MRKGKFLALAAVVAMLVPMTASAAVQVNFVEPEHYTDAGLYHYGAKAKQQTFRLIERELQRLAERYLSPEETLTIDILDIDLAGRFEPWQFPYDDVRFVRDITWPRIKLRYSLTGGPQPRSAEETVSDPMYLTFPQVGYSGEPLRYEKAMLQRWFRMRFGERRPAAGS